MIEHGIIIFVLIVGCLLAYKMKALKLSGLIAAIIVGISIYLGLGIKGLLVLFAFFVSSSFWSKYRGKDKVESEAIGEKDDIRDWEQVLVNGGIPSIASLIYFFTEDYVWIIAFSIALAASNADTWASEIGVLSKRKPIHIFTLKRVNRGTSGAVSLLGTTAGLLGACFIGIIAFILWNQVSVHELLLITLFGFISMLVDTILGSTIQRKYRCNQCGLITEKKYHCHQQTVPFSGIPSINNDAVNFLSVLILTIVGVVLF